MAAKCFARVGFVMNILCERRDRGALLPVDAEGAA
jgi:hypothetical protein